MTSEDIEIEKLRTYAATVAAKVTDDDLAHRPLEVILEELINTRGPQPIVLDVANRYYGHSGSRVELKYPFRGDLSLLMEVSEIVGRGQSSGGKSVAEFALNIESQFGDDFAEQLEQAGRWSNCRCH